MAGSQHSTPVRGAADFMDSKDSSWQATLDINLRAALVGTRLAAQVMSSQKARGQDTGKNICSDA